MAIIPELIIQMLKLSIDDHAHINLKKWMKNSIYF